MDKLMSVLVALRYSANIAQFISILNLYLGIYYDESIIQTIFVYFEELFGIKRNQSDIMEHQVDTFETVKQLLGNWKAIRDSEAASKLYKFLAMVLTIGLCKINSIKFNIGNLNVFHMEAEKRVYSFSDIVEVCFETVIYFYERGHEAFQSKDPWRLFYSDDKLLTYEKEFTYMVAAAPLIELNNWDEMDCTIQEFELRLDNIFLMTQEMIKGAPHGSYRNVLNGKLLALQKVKTKLMISKRNTTMRVKPFSLLLFGKTGVGKSTMLDYLINYLSKYNGFPVGPEYKCTLNPSDQYDSSYHSTAISVIMDDIANATPQATTGNPCLKIIDFINNDPKDALKADVDSKGNVKIQPKFVFGTTNKKSLDAYVYSNEPASISRRFDYTITVKVRPEYRRDDCEQIDGAKIPQGVTPDVWLFTVEIVIPIPNEAGGPDTISYKIVSHNGQLLQNIGLGTLLDFLGRKSKDHFDIQHNMLRGISDIQKKPMCIVCGNYPDLCGHNQLVHQVEDKNVPWRFIPKSWSEPPPPPQPQFWYHKAIDNFDDFIADIPYFPGLLIGMGRRQSKLAYQGYKFATKAVWSQNKLVGACLIIPVVIIYIFIMIFVSPFYYAPCLGVMGIMALDDKLSIVADSLTRKAKRTCLVKMSDEKWKKVAAGVKIAGYGVISLSTFLMLRMLYRNYKRLHNLQGSDECVPQPSDTEKVNPWKKSIVIPLEYTMKSKTTTFEQLCSEVGKVICHCTAYEPDTGRRFVSDIMPVGRNVWIMNGHAIRGKDLEVEIITHSPQLIGGNFKSMISPINCHFVEDSDLVFVYLPAGGDRKDLSDYIPSTWLQVSGPSRLIYKDNTGALDTQSVHFNGTIVEVDDMRCKGYGYKTQKPTFAGQCMSVLIADLRFPMIIGFHFAGKTGDRMGAATYVTKHMIEQAIERLSMLPGTLLSAHTGDFLLEPIGPYKNVNMLGKSHDKCPTNFLSEDGTMRNYGSHDGPRRNFKSSVCRTIISDSVTEIMGQECMHGPPKNMNSWQPWHRALANYVHPHVLHQGLITVSAYDFEHSIINAVPDETYRKTCPLDDVSTLAGADGVYGIDSINMSTGAGHPFNCPKTDIFTRLDKPSETHNMPIVAPEWFYAECDRVKKILISGKRAYLPFKAHLKDEPTKLTKDKVRVFTGSSIVALALVRKYYLPLCKIVMDNPYLFECAVGINAHGPEWDTFTKNVTKFGSDRMVAGDYKDYDATMPASLTLAGFSLFIKMARKCGYTEEQIKIMEGLATEICYPVYEYNGSFIGIHGSNPSGHPLTVFINSFANSLYLRYAYYYICEPKPGQYFNQYVALQCYGDDNIFSVSKELPTFNHTSISKALALYDVTYTMAEKDQESIPYIDISQCTFLKRRMVYSAELGLYIGPLEEASLFKTLHCVLRSDVLNPRQQAAECIKCTLQEWFLHGKTKYDMRRTQLLEIISKNDLSACFDKPLPTYEESLDTFREKYMGQPSRSNPVSDPLVGGVLKIER